MDLDKTYAGKKTQTKQKNKPKHSPIPEKRKKDNTERKRNGKRGKISEKKRQKERQNKRAL